MGSIIDLSKRTQILAFPFCSTISLFSIQELVDPKKKMREKFDRMTEIKDE